MPRTKQQVYDRIAGLYDFLDVPFEHSRYRPLRRALCAGLHGRVLDAGVGTGANMPHYPQDAEVVGIDLSAKMLARAERRRVELGAAVELRQIDATATGFPDDHFDFVISTFMFCVLDDAHQVPALRELGRVCKPNGEIRVIEYAVSRHLGRRMIMALWAPWVRLAYGARFNRRTERYAAAANLDLREERFLFKDMIKLLVMRPRSS